MYYPHFADEEIEAYKDFYIGISGKRVKVALIN